MSTTLYALFAFVVFICLVWLAERYYRPALPVVSSMRGSGHPLFELAGTAGQVVLLAGYYHPGDGGGGTFVWSDIPAKHDGGVVVNPSGWNAAGWRRVSVSPYNARWFGAIADEKSHPLSEFYETLADAQATYPFVQSLTREVDACAVQQTINAAKYNHVFGTFTAARDVFLPAGAYYLDQTIEVWQLAGLKVFGEGNATCMRWHGSTDKPVFKVDDCSDCEFSRLWVLMPGTFASACFLLENGPATEGSPALTACKFIDLVLGGYGGQQFKHGFNIVNPNQDANNDLHRFVRCRVDNYTQAAWHIRGGQAHALSFYDCSMNGGGVAAFGVFCEYGCFIYWLRGSGGNHNETDFRLADFHITSVIDGWNSEHSAKLCTAGSGTGAPTPVTIRNCRFDTEILTCWNGVDGGEVICNWGVGPTIVAGNYFGATNLNPRVYQMLWPGSSYLLDMVDNVWRGPNKYTTSAAHATGATIIEHGNLYYDPETGHTNTLG